MTFPYTIAPDCDINNPLHVGDITDRPDFQVEITTDHVAGYEIYSDSPYYE